MQSAPTQRAAFRVLVILVTAVTVHTVLTSTNAPMMPTTVTRMHSALITLAVSPVNVTQATKAMAQTAAILMSVRLLIVVRAVHVRMQSVK
jgi:hypothetical protein